ncbi:16S rRNA (guanine(966)-N(2))-methyltransferase RsmD [Paracoccus suum]|uniref:16S rRNA (Guanine(966)-N(2))-methyltransferase RsmD n=1 Tax=Paracoccus suum TaxID=2259340 RepID=A0A344PGP7_9RHOB|nr:16S rRNA (guanine(966)-N(2))-methyltransferase RsmD [Paracoccus suum]AXC48552.1 16S rRNA (guanine(966)-N(2))-methyltransferase RsmD [Paracoccus suum]
MRIVGGRMRGLKLAEVGAGDPAAHLRPTSDRVREAIFNLLVNGGHGNPLAGARVLDLFAGTGAMALEALSRGASEATLVESGRAAQALIRRNLTLARAEDCATLLPRDATRLPPCTGPGFDLVFLDPPYARSMGEATIGSAVAGHWIADNALIVWEESVAPAIPAALRQIDQRRYGDTLVTLARYNPAND